MHGCRGDPLEVLPRVQKCSRGSDPGRSHWDEGNWTMIGLHDAAPIVAQLQSGRGDVQSQTKEKLEPPSHDGQFEGEWRQAGWGS